MPWIYTILIGLIALALSMFFGFTAREIFSLDFSGKSKAYKFYQFYINFIGSLVGWICVWVLCRAFYQALIHHQQIKPDLSDIFIGVIGFIGISGHLPYTMVGLIHGLGDLGKRVIQKVAGG